MHGWQVTAHGHPDKVLRWSEDVPEPAPGPGQVLVEVHAAACNFPDILMCEGTYQAKPQLPFVLGMEVAGEVVAAGHGASAAVGDRVIGMPPPGRGGFAERTVLDAVSTLPWPAGASATEAAAMLISYQTSFCALHRRAALQPGETLLVHAAAGGVGSAAVQLGKAAGARVIGTAGGAGKCRVAAEQGADEVIDYSVTDLVAAVREITGGRGADVVVDPVGGDVFDASRRVVAFEGRILVIGFAGGRIAAAPTNHALIKNYSVVGVHWGYYRERAPDLVPVWQAELEALWRSGRIRPLVGAQLPLENAPEALRLLAGRRTVGKVVLVR